MAEQKTATKKLIAAIESTIEAYAEMMTAISKGKEPKVTIKESDMNMALKMVDKIGNLEQFDKIANGESPEIVTTETTTTETVVKQAVNGNPFEERSKKVQEKINGKKA